MELQESPEVDEMQEKLELRRIQRRRKILENAKSRLEKLNMRQNGDGDTELVNIRASVPLVQECEYSDPEVEPNIPEHFHMQTPAFQQQPHNLQFEDTLKNFESTRNYEQTQENEKIYIKYKLHVILAVSIAYMATLILNENEGQTFYVIIPFALVLVSDLTIFYQQRQRNPMIDMLVLFGIRAHKIVFAINVATKIQIVITDLSIFIFYFCIAAFLGNQFVHLADIK
ncbi:uncharacterized protein l(2)SH0834 isoform X2 [Eurosta solidaginis]|uniref:uncharacterized protein l(2)SH0834 isoform X2 n=1 Tax=Eurosta solidaginis TaxID=178769 RepID=UPI0035311386